MNEVLLERVLKSPRLPSLPAIALEVIDLVQQKNVDIKQIANTIKHDPCAVEQNPENRKLEFLRPGLFHLDRQPRVGCPWT